MQTTMRLLIGVQEKQRGVGGGGNEVVNERRWNGMELQDIVPVSNLIVTRRICHRVALLNGTAFELV